MTTDMTSPVEEGNFIHRQLYPRPSSAYIWLPKETRCTGHLTLEPVPDRGSVFADRGTRLHKAVAECLAREETVLGEDLFKRLPPGEGAVVKSALDALVTEVAPRSHAFPTLWDEFHVVVEEPRNLSFDGEDRRIANLKGTPDLVLYRRDAEKATPNLRPDIIVVDFKFGEFVEVDPVDNPQLLCYMLLASLGSFPDKPVAEEDSVSREIGFPVDLDDYRRELSRVAAAGWIVQPSNLDRGESKIARRGKVMTSEDMLKAFFEVKEAFEQGLRPVPRFNPSFDNCRWCSSKFTCPGLRNVLNMHAMRSWPSSSVATPGESAIHPHEYADVVRKIDGLTTLRKEIVASAHGLMEQGTEVPGMKLVKGRPGNRKWKEGVEPKEIQGIVESFGGSLGSDDILTLRTPPDLERRLPDGLPRGVKKQVKEALQPLTERSEGTVQAVLSEAPGDPVFGIDASDAAALEHFNKAKGEKS